MTRLDHDCAMATAKAVLGMVAHLLRPEEQAEFFGMACEAVKAGLTRRDELLARECRRLCKPGDN